MVHVGFDMHGDSSYLFALDDATGEIVLDTEVPSARQVVCDLLASQGERGSLRIVMEACGFAGYWADVLEPYGEVVAVHPQAINAYKTNKRKTDRRDADFLVALSQVNRLPVAYLGTTEERDLKDLLRYRVGLVQVRTRLRVRLRTMAQRYGTKIAAGDVDGPKARRIWEALELRETHRELVTQLLQLLSDLAERIRVIEERIHDRASKDWRVAILDTLPGLDCFGSLLAAAEIGDVTRFHGGAALACFAGLVPSEHSSGGRERRGRITREGSAYLRWIMVQAALKSDRSPRLHRLYERVKRRSGKMRARVAVAREMLVIAYHMLRNRAPYEERPPHRRSGKSVPTLTH